MIGSYPFPGWLEFACRNLDQFGETDREELIEDAVLEVWREGWRTQDMAGPGHHVVGCREMGDRLRGAWPDTVARGGNSKAHRRLYRPGLFVGDRFSVDAMERRRK